MSLTIQNKFDSWLEKQLSFPGETAEKLALKKRFWINVSPGIFIIGLSGLIIWFLGLPTIGLTMGLFSGFELILVVVFMIFRRKPELFTIINSCFFVLASFAGVLYFGGILNSAGIVFVGLVGALHALFFLKPVQIRIIFAIYILTIVIEAFLQPNLIPLPEITPNANLILFVIHFLVIAFSLFYVLSYYISQGIKIKEREEKRLQELDTIKTNFYTNITHEFRTPLTVIMGMCEQIEKDPQKFAKHGLHLIRQNSIRLLQLVNQILDLSKLEAKSMQLHLVQQDIILFLRNATEPFKHLANEKKIRFHFLSDFNEFHMDFDPDKIQIIIGNLLSNAIKYSNTDSDIYCTISEESQKETDQKSQFTLFPDRKIKTERILKLSVKDIGNGIAEKEFPLIFDRFYQVPDKRIDHHKGTGIGLLLVKELVNLLQANLELKSVIGKGSEFSILFPVSHDAAETAIHETTGYEVNTSVFEMVEPDKKKQSLKNLPHLLIIEDNDDVVSYLRYIAAEEYHIDRASNGEQGLEIALEIIPDIVLCDIMMPKKNGYEVCKTLKEDFRTSHIPVILLTAKADKESQITGIGFGADAYISKPFDSKELMVQMHTLIEFRKKLIAKFRTFAIASISDSKDPVNPDELFLRKLKEILEENYEDDNFDITQLTQKIGMSRVQLFRKLKALTGVSASHFIRFFRLSRAKEKIVGTNQRISEIAYEVGFRDPAYFTRAFSKEFGITPSSLRV